MALIFDIETDGLLPELTKVHSLCIKDTTTGKTYSCTDNDPRRPSIAVGLQYLAGADMIIGHNILSFDVPALQKVYPKWKPEGIIRDTLVMSRLIWSDIKPLDYPLWRKGTLPGNLIGSHSLKAWGYRIGILKGTFGDTTDWSTWTPEMQTYCARDVVVTSALWDLIETKKFSEESIQLEHDFRRIMDRQEQNGFHFNVDAAQKLYATLAPMRDAAAQELRHAFPSWWTAKSWQKNGDAKDFDPERNDSRWHYVKGAKCCPIKLVEFKPTSTDHVAFCFKRKYDWEPVEFTETGKPKVDEDVIKGLPYPEAEGLAHCLMLNKRVSQLAEGKKAWLKVERDGIIYGRVKSQGTVTGRCSHINPNIAQVPSLHNKKGPVAYGRECRELFYAPPGWVMVGCDASGLELRMLAHYMARWDDGAYAKEVLEGDIHTVNMLAAGLPARDPAKTFIYAFLYGAGDPLLGGILEPFAPEATRKRIGARLRSKFLKGLPALKELTDAVKIKAKKARWLKGLDGRRIPVRHMHAALNTLLQSAGAIVMKRATVNQWNMLHDDGLIEGEHWKQIANIHDENQLYVLPELTDRVGEIAAEAIRLAGRQFNLRIPLDGEYKSGPTWADTH